MYLRPLDITVFLAFFAVVISVSLYKSKREETSEDYFLAGRGLSWWLIGFSLIAANISTEQFVGMSGQAADYVGLAIASYEWMAAITLVIVAFVFLPKFLRTGIYTIPEYLEHRYSPASRSIMAGFMIIIYVGVTIAAVIYSGALTVHTLFAGKTILGIPINVTSASWLIGIVAAVYVASGGLKACAWADLFQGSALIIGGAVITYLAFTRLGAMPLADITHTNAAVEGLTESSGGITRFFALNSDKLHMVLPKTDLILPWTALVVGLWIPNFYYWGLNQYITQRTLGSKSLSQGQKGVVFAAALKLIIPFIIVFPGIMAFNIFSGDMAAEASRDPATIIANEEVLSLYEEIQSGTAEVSAPVVISFDDGWASHHPEKAVELALHNEAARQAAEEKGVAPVTRALIGYKYDTAFGLLIAKLVPGGRGLQGFILAAILGAVISSLASMLNSASTIFTMDIFKKHISKEASEKALVLIGRICVGVFVGIGCFISPLLGDPKFSGIFTYIQEFQGFISPGILAVFLFGIIVKRAPALCGIVGLIINPLIYGLLKMLLPGLAFLDRMAVSFAGVLLVMTVITLIRPLAEPKKIRVRSTIDLEASKTAKALGLVVIIMTLVLYAVFW
ncbi:sodium/solute symporter [bacterium]|nr:sodium/solute symporter [bacterium]